MLMISQQFSFLSLLRTIPTGKASLGLLFLNPTVYQSGCNRLLSSFLEYWKGKLVLFFSFNHFLCLQLSLLTVFNV